MIVYHANPIDIEEYGCKDGKQGGHQGNCNEISAVRSGFEGFIVFASFPILSFRWMIMNEMIMRMAMVFDKYKV